MELDDDTIKEMLKSISLSGSADANAAVFKPVVASKAQAPNILNLTSGLPRISWNYLAKFEPIIGKPTILSPLNSFEIRCCLCNKIISYPCWYYQIRYAVNWFHYFVCFNAMSPRRVTAVCYRRD